MNYITTENIKRFILRFVDEKLILIKLLIYYKSASINAINVFELIIVMITLICAEIIMDK